MNRRCRSRKNSLKGASSIKNLISQSFEMPSNGSKAFKFADKDHIKTIQNEFMQFKMHKLENEQKQDEPEEPTELKVKCFEYKQPLTEIKAAHLDINIPDAAFQTHDPRLENIINEVSCNS